MKPKVQATGKPVARERRDGGQVKLSTFIPLKIRKRAAARSPSARACTTQRSTNYCASP